jgi:hypothetical protein
MAISSYQSPKGYIWRWPTAEIFIQNARSHHSCRAIIMAKGWAQSYDRMICITLKAGMRYERAFRKAILIESIHRKDQIYRIKGES